MLALDRSSNMILVSNAAAFLTMLGVVLDWSGNMIAMSEAVTFLNILGVVKVAPQA